MQACCKHAAELSGRRVEISPLERLNISLLLTVFVVCLVA